MLVVLPLETSKDLKRNWPYFLVIASTFVFGNTGNTGINNVFHYIASFFSFFFFNMVSELRLYFSKVMDNYSDEG